MATLASSIQNNNNTINNPLLQQARSNVAANALAPVAYSGNTYAPASKVQQTGTTPVTQSWAPQRVIDAIYEARKQGFNDADIAQGLGRYGVSMAQAQQAFQSINPQAPVDQATLSSVNKGYVDMGLAPTSPGAPATPATPTAPPATPAAPATPAMQPPAAPQPWQQQPAWNPYLSQPPAIQYNNQYKNPLNTPTTAGASNPYLDQMAKSIEQQINQNLTRNLLPSIGRGAVAAGGYGGSRQGIAEGIAMGDTQNALSNSLANLYGQSYYQDRNYDLTRIGQDQGFYNAQRGLDLQQQGGLQNFYTAQRGQDLQQQGQSFNQYLSALNAAAGLGQGMTNIGQQQMYAGLGPLQGLSGILNPYTGLNQQGGSYGGGLAGALGGGLTAAQLVRLLGG